MAVAYYQFAFMSAREDKKIKPENGIVQSQENLKTSIKLFQKIN